MRVFLARTLGLGPEIFYFISAPHRQPCPEIFYFISAPHRQPCGFCRKRFFNFINTLSEKQSTFSRKIRGSPRKKIFSERAFFAFFRALFLLFFAPFFCFFSRPFLLEKHAPPRCARLYELTRCVPPASHVLALSRSLHS
jgi:hypothetical protein